MIRDLGTMKILKEKDTKIHYVIIQIGGKTYSTTFDGKKDGKDIAISKKQLAETEGIGQEDNLWIKGKFTETANHSKLPEEIPFQLNVYSKIPPSFEKQSTL